MSAAGWRAGSRTISPLITLSSRCRPCPPVRRLLLRLARLVLALACTVEGRWEPTDEDIKAAWRRMRNPWAQRQSHENRQGRVLRAGVYHMAAA